MKGFFPASDVLSERPDKQSIAKCGSCGLYKRCQSPKMAWQGQGLRKVLIVNEYPEEEDDQQNRHLVGPGGLALKQVLSGLGINAQRDAWTTSALICRPHSGHETSTEQVGYCHPNLANTIKELEPNVIITLGKPALESAIKPYWLGDFESLDRWLGWQIPSDTGWICPTYHPNFLARMKNSLMDKLFEEHLEEAFAIYERPPRRKNPNVELLFQTGDIIRALRDIDSEGGWAAVDYETNCLKPEYEGAIITSFGVSNGRRTIAYPWKRDVVQPTSVFLKSSRTRKIASNLKMEERWTIHFLGHPVTNWGWDTMIAAHVIDNRPNITSLKFQAFVLMGVPTYNVKVEKFLRSAKDSKLNQKSEIGVETLLTYNGLDAYHELNLAMVQRKMMGYED